jgi:sugar/nucleoside kinase (ribokinase family)
VSFVTVTALRLGYSVGLVTSAAHDFPFDVLRSPCREHEVCRSAAAHLTVTSAAADASTRFVNRYVNGRREQRMLSRAADVTVADALRAQGIEHASMVFLGPVAGEIALSAVQTLPRVSVGVALQGWLRAWDADGIVRRSPWSQGMSLGSASVAVVSEEDSETSRLPAEWGDVPVLVVTDGVNGSRLRWRGAWWHVPAFPAREVDPTGAGDVFATALLIRLRETCDPLLSAMFASAAAALSVEGEGLAAVPCPVRVNGLLRQRPLQVRPL